MSNTKGLRDLLNFIELNLVGFGVGRKFLNEAKDELNDLEIELEEAWDTAEAALEGWEAEAEREGQNPHGDFRELYDRVPEKKP